MQIILLCCLPILLSQCKSTKEATAPVVPEQIEDDFTESVPLPDVNTQMRKREQLMFNEINTLRKNPQSYVKDVRSYLARVSNDTRRSYDARQVEMAAARELILELTRTRPLPPLEAHEGLYLLAQKQAQDMNVAGAFTHIGLDGTAPWERIQRYTNLREGNENFIAGADQMKDALLALLVDGSISGRGHRMNILNPNWTFGAIHFAEELNGVAAGWIQVFGCCEEQNVPAVRLDKQEDLYAALDPESTQKTLPGFVTVEPVNRPTETDGAKETPTNYEEKEAKRLPATNDKTQAPKLEVKEKPSAPSVSTNTEPSTKPSINMGQKPKVDTPTEPIPPKPEPEKSKPTMTTQTAPGAKPAALTKSKAPYMSEEERIMMDEVNLMRSNPKAYIPYVQEYLENYKNAGWDEDSVAEEERVGKELIHELERLGPLSRLTPDPKLYRVASAHGVDMKRMGSVTHTGSDGSSPFGRIKKGTNLQSGNENLVGGGLDVRESVIMLLVDSGIPGRGHRRTLLKAEWDTGAMVKVGKVGEMPNVWAQLFGKR